MKFAFLIIAIFINLFNQSLIKSEEEIDSANNKIEHIVRHCLLYTSDAADE